MIIKHYYNAVKETKILSMLKKHRFGFLNLKKLPEGKILHSTTLYYPYWVVKYQTPSVTLNTNKKHSKLTIIIDGIKGDTGIIDGKPEILQSDIDETNIFIKNITKEKAIELGKNEAQLYAARYWKSLRTIFETVSVELIYKPLWSIHYRSSSNLDYLILIDGVSGDLKVLNTDIQTINYFLRKSDLKD